MLRILHGVDVLETRYSAAKRILEEAGLNILGAAIEAFEDWGPDVPIVTGEDQHDFLQKWQEIGMSTIATPYPTNQWRTPILAALKALDSEAIPGSEWNLPQPATANDNLADFLNPAIPPLHYAACGCERMPGYPERWRGK
ncbi:hypothetical protein [Ruegeria hyattellae]|uniref:hypothetical protein n=1 Tax=Ruegeria hyattellae TaxID=3233337 RepID=UPI00355BADF4